MIKTFSHAVTQYQSNAFMVHRVERYDLTGKRIFEIGEKYYFENLGLRNVITAEGFFGNTHKGIHVYSIREFLTGF